MHLEYLDYDHAVPAGSDIPLSHKRSFTISPNYQTQTKSPANPITPARTETGGSPIAEPELGAFPTSGSTPLLGPVEVADATIPEADEDVAGVEVMVLLPAGEVAVVLMMVPVPGKGAMEGAEKLPNPLGSPVLLGILPVS